MFDEVIGFLVKGTIYSGQDALELVKTLEDYDEVITRNRIKFMVACDVGKKWEELLQQPTLFYVDNMGIPSWTLPNIRPMKAGTNPYNES